MFLFELSDSTDIIVRKFVKFAADYLDLKKVPHVEIMRDSGYSADNHTFGHYTPDSNGILVQVENRQIIDILRTLAHELVHSSQAENGKLTANSGETGSEQENEANAVAGVIMRNFTKLHPVLFGRQAESKINEVAEIRTTSAFKQYLAKVKLRQPGNVQIVDTQVMATSLNMAIKLLRAQYGKDNLVGTPREVGKDRR